MKPLVLLQVRSSSKRLPYKALLLINSIPNIILLAKRILSKNYNYCILTSKDKSDDFLSYILKKKKIKYFRGDLLNVKKRFLDYTKKLSDENIIVRATADNLLVDKYLILKCINFFKNQNTPYMILDSKKNFLPHGISLEIFYLGYLRKSKKNTKKDLEHVTFSLKKNFITLWKNKFKNKLFYNKNCSLDHLEDYIFLKKLFKNFTNKSKWYKFFYLLKKIKVNKKKYNLKVLSIKTKNLSFNQKIKICKLKMKYWKFNINSQLKFIKNNYSKNDIHHLVFNNSKIIGYNCLKSFRKPDFNCLVFDSLIVNPSFRKIGISNILISISMNKIINFDKSCFLYANKNSIKTYKIYGWREVKKNKYFKMKKDLCLMKFK